MGNLVFGSAERLGNSADAAEIPVVRDNDVAIGQGARPTERPEKASAAARHTCTKLNYKIAEDRAISNAHQICFTVHISCCTSK